jgi:hypothetical protein
VAVAMAVACGCDLFQVAPPAEFGPQNIWLFADGMDFLRVVLFSVS